MARYETAQDEYKEQIVAINRVSKTVKGGRIFKFAALVVVGDGNGTVGFGFARAVTLQCAQLEGLLWALDTMQSEMSARLTPLAQLFSGLSACRQKDVAAFFAEAGRALSAQPYCTVPVCFKRGFQQAKGFRPGDESVQALYGLSLNLGRFDLESQLAAIERTKESVTAALLALQGQKRARCRSYETIGICAGLALAVMLL